MGLTLSELLREHQIEEQRFEAATTEEALNHLIGLIEKVELGEIGGVVLAANLLEKRGPELEGRSIRNIPTDSGDRSVSGETWIEAIGCYLETLGLPTNFPFENIKKGTIGEERTKAFPNGQILLKRIRKYDSGSKLTLVRLEISHIPLGE